MQKISVCKKKQTSMKYLCKKCKYKHTMNAIP